MSVRFRDRGYERAENRQPGLDQRRHLVASEFAATILSEVSTRRLALQYAAHGETRGR